MPNFPTLSIGPSAGNYVESPVIDPTIRSQYEGGAILTRARFTAVPKQWQVSYRYMSTTDKETLQAFEKTVNYGSDSFSWTPPTNSNTYSVRFGAPIKFKVESDGPAQWSIGFRLIETTPDSEI